MAPSANPRQLREHDRYYLRGADLHFLVEGRIFRVHRYFFERESAYWRELLSAPATPGKLPHGTDSNAMVLDDVTCDDFDSFLWVFYNPRYSIYDAPWEVWSAILKLAHKWGFAEVKRLAIDELQKHKFADIDRIVLYHDTEVDRNLLVPCYAALCERENPLSLPECVELGMETAHQIFRAREQARGVVKSPGSGVRSPAPIAVKQEEMHSLVKVLFGVEVPAPPTPAKSPTGDTTEGAKKSPPVPHKLDIAAATATNGAVNGNDHNHGQGATGAGGTNPPASMANGASSDTSKALGAHSTTAAETKSLPNGSPSAGNKLNGAETANGRLQNGLQDLSDDTKTPVDANRPGTPGRRAIKNTGTGMNTNANGKNK